MNTETLMIFLLCLYIPIGVVMGLFALLQILEWTNDEWKT
jgi:hypothetical protein